jgi:hypothetical protein
MSESIYPPSSQALAPKRRELAPTIQSAFDAFSQSVFAEGALPAKTRSDSITAAPRRWVNGRAGTPTSLTQTESSISAE